MMSGGVAPLEPCMCRVLSLKCVRSQPLTCSYYICESLKKFVRSTECVRVGYVEDTSTYPHVAKVKHWIITPSLVSTYLPLIISPCPLHAEQRD